jgi:glycosyltransferase involved in cell wall biosynthesis
MIGVRRLLAVSWDMPPQSGPRAVQVSRTVRELVSHGWLADIICFDSRSGRYFPDRDLAARLALPSGVGRMAVRSLEESWPIRALWRVCPPAKRLPDEKRVWIGAATRAGLRAARQQQYNALVSFAQPWSDHLIGLRLHRALGLPWVAHFSDPWVAAPEGYAPLPRWQRRMWERWERDVISEAAAVVFVNRQTADATMRRYPPEWARKAHVVPHGFDRADVPPVAPPIKDSAERPMRLVYTGRFYGDTRTPAPLFRALARLAKTRELAREASVTLVGPILAEHQNLAASLGLTSIVEFVGRVPFSDSERRASAADVLLVIDAPSADSLFLPSKLIDYLPLGRPILGITPVCGAAADVIRALGYPVAAPDDEAAIAAAIGTLLDAHAAGTLAASPQHPAVAAQYDIRVTARAFADVLDACAA